MAEPGDIVRSTDDAWMELAPTPTDCPNGHQLGRNRVLVGWRACSCRGGHRTWDCRECGAVVFAPPVTERCRLLNGAT